MNASKMLGIQLRQMKKLSLRDALKKIAKTKSCMDIEGPLHCQRCLVVDRCPKGIARITLGIKER